ncbi:hypothetical protein P3T76_001895 [Phytophthora citrophthora]|uniref:Uncharacterized protein n=1 Tax=Phytophthora citrophthora TaxID=4793 RepID=A0AAD9LTE5_9STRA|nr:hypothetical protein P3T76_001895 [Phytophthora citrophthora]
MLLTRCFKSSMREAPLLAAVAGVYSQNVRWMGRGPTIQGKKNATDAVQSSRSTVLHAVDLPKKTNEFFAETHSHER